MKKETEGLEYVIISRNGLDDFKDYIMPHVYEQLFTVSDFGEENITAIGALVRGIPAGCVIAELLPEDEIFIHSIVVASNCQRMGIGTSLVEALLQIGSDTFEYVWGENRDKVRVFLHTEYVMPDEICDAFEAFLKSAGFTDFGAYEDTVLFDLSRLPVPREMPVEAHAFSSVSGFESDIENLFLSIGAEPIMDMSFYTGTEEEPNYLMMLSRESDDLLALSSVKASDSASKEEYGALASLTIRNAKKKYPDCRLIIGGDRNLYMDFWTALAETSGTVLRKREAGLYALIEGGEQ